MSEPQELSAASSATGSDAPPPPSVPPPRGPGILALLFVLVVALIAFWAGHRFGDTAGTAMANLRDGTAQPAGTDSAEAETSYYTCGMHPWVILPRPGLCPICQMDLTPLDPAKFTGEVTIDPVMVQNIGVRIEPVVSGELSRTLRTVGTVDFDETSLRDVNPKVSGWIEKLHVSYLGSPVQEGEPLFDFYSPELYAAQEEFLLAREGADRLRSASDHRAAERAQDLLRDTRTRLEYFDLTPEQIDSLSRSDKPAKAVAMLSPYSGVVIEKHANEGMRIEPGMQLYRIADLSRVWVIVTLYEYQLPYVELGQRAVMSLPYLPGATFEGRVLYIYPYIDKRTREVSVRLEFENPDGMLKPGMFANVELRSTLARERTLAPRSAVIDTGERQVAFVSLGEGAFEPRNVRMGIQADAGRVEILEGLKPGEMVVTSGQFLIDSEARLREALGKMIRGELASDQQVVAAVAGQSELESMPPAMAASLGDVLDAYFTAGDLLAGDTVEGLAAPASSIAAGMNALLDMTLDDAPHFWHQHLEAATVRGKALELGEQELLAEARLRFADLSTALTALVKATGVAPGYPQEVWELHCPMYREGQGGSSWLQPAGDVRNPYFGAVMLSCFDERHALPVTGGAGGADAVPAGGGDGGEPVAPDGEGRDPPPTMGTEPARPEPLVKGQSELDGLVAAYLRAQRALAGDDESHLGELWSDMHEAAAALGREGEGSPAETAADLAPTLAAAPEGMAGARLAFRDLSLHILALTREHPPSASVAPIFYEARCPMAKASWLQTEEAISNPYYGASMLTCGSVKAEYQAVEARRK